MISATRWLDDAKWWVLHRTLYRYHVVRCHGLKPGYHEVEDQLLHAAFGLLVDFVEIQCAGMHWMIDEKKNTGWRRFIESFRLGHYRSRKDGLAHLDWEVTLKYDESHGVHPDEERYGKTTWQAERAAITKELYLWWLDERPKRPDPHDVSGYSEAWKAWDENCQSRGVAGTAARFKDRPEELGAAAVRAEEIEEGYHEEDTRQLKRLAEIRRSLWT